MSPLPSSLSCGTPAAAGEEDDADVDGGTWDGGDITVTEGDQEKNKGDEHDRRVKAV